MNKVIQEIAAERERQVNAEGWDPGHDDEHADGSLAAAAACYAQPEPRGTRRTRRTGTEDVAGRGEGPVFGKVTRWYTVPISWPKSWHPCWWKPKDRRRDLIRAAALIVAEIERLDRAIKLPVSMGEAQAITQVCEGCPHPAPCLDNGYCGKS